MIDIVKIQTFSDYNIDTGNRTSGRYYTVCPQCSHDRKKKQAKSLSVEISKGVWKCHHCGWKGGLKKANSNGHHHFENKTPLSDFWIEWLLKRNISQDVANTMRITCGPAWMVQAGEKVSTIQFPFFKNGQLINTKYRDADKHFQLTKGAPLILYNLDGIKDCSEVFIVEGEMDALSLIQKGINNVVSVPNGANNNLNFIDNCQDELKHVTRFNILTDFDGPGERLAYDLAQKLGPEKCFRLTLAEGCKDANEMLCKHGDIYFPDTIPFTEIPEPKHEPEIKTENDSDYATTKSGFPFTLFPKKMQQMTSAQVMALVARAAFELNRVNCLSKCRGWAPQGFNFYIFIYGESTRNKTANCEPAYRDLFKIQSEELAGYRAELERVSRDNKGKKPADREPEPERPVSFIFKNATIEALESPLQKTAVLYVPGEARTIINNYQKDAGENIDAVLCEFWNGESYVSTRVTRGVTHIDRVKLVIYTSCVTQDLDRLFMSRKNGGFLYRSLLIRAEGTPCDDDKISALGCAISETVLKTTWVNKDEVRLHPKYPFIKSLNGEEYDFRKLDQYQQRLTPVIDILYNACGETPGEPTEDLALKFMRWYNENFQSIMDDIDGTSQAISEGVIDIKTMAEEKAAPELWQQVMVKFKLGSRRSAYRKIRELENKGLVQKRYGKYEWV
jgi:5S rRNA maturation endonuclease (ribonuclease M5)